MSLLEDFIQWLHEWFEGVFDVVQKFFGWFEFVVFLNFFKFWNILDFFNFFENWFDNFGFLDLALDFGFFNGLWVSSQNFFGVFRFNRFTNFTFVGEHAVEEGTGGTFPN